MSDLPTGIVTFLLTDIEGSSRLWQERRDEASALIEHHDTLIRQAVESHGGVLVKSKGEGDSTFSVFARPTDALTAAVETQRVLPDEVHTRAALHTGEAELRDGEYYGNTVNRCARLRAIAHGGQTVCSQTTRDLIEDALPVGVSLLDLGLHELRDQARPEHVWQVTCNDLTPTFPPLRSQQSAPNNLPMQLTSFVGRKTEIDEVCALLRANRVVTLTGAGGVGKTRLATEVGSALLQEHPDGNWLVDLAAITTSELVPKALASAAGVRELPLRSTTDLLLTDMKNKATLVILDNCEHLLDASAELVEKLVHGCATVRVLATSREPLGVAGELPWRVPSLALPQSDELAAEADAVRLFCDRAMVSRPNFALTKSNAAAVTDICRQLDGIPLAIELAAARVRVLSPQQIASGLSDRFHLLTGGGPRASARQRTLEASVDWSYNLLSDEERVLLRRLSVFVGGFTLDAAEAMCADGAVDSYRVLDLLSSLVDKSLVQVEDEGARARYGMLETIRQYAAQRVVDATEGQVTGDLHLEYCIELAGRDRSSVEVAAAMAELEADHDNFRSALEWATRTGRTHDGLRLGTSLFDFWLHCGHSREGFRRLEAVLESGNADPALRSRALAAASFLSPTVDPGNGLRYAEEALSIARGLEDERLLSRALVSLARNRLLIDHAVVRATCEEALPLAQRIGDTTTEFTAFLFLGFVDMYAGDYKAARRWLEDALAVTEGSPGRGDDPSMPQRSYRPLWRSDRTRRAWVHHVLGQVLAMTTDLREAEEHSSRALALAREVGERVVIADTLANLSILATASGELDVAERFLGEATELAEKMGGVGGFLLIARGQLRLATGDFAAAAADFEAGVRESQALGHTSGMVASLGLGAVALVGTDLDAARQMADRALDLARGLQMPFPLGMGLHVRGWLARLDGDERRAEAMQCEAIELSLSSNNKAGVLMTLEELAVLRARDGKPEEAARLCGAASAIRASTGAATRYADLDLDGIRSALGSEHFDVAWAEGAAMSLAEAVAYALRGRGDRSRPASGWESLTPTELEVAGFVSAGLSNPQIAEKLFISRRTVTTHLTHIFAKLGLSSRTELATEAMRRGVLA